MPYFLLVVEGAHDAAFFGVLLRRRQLTRVMFRSNVVPYWERLIPKQFPADPSGRLDHVVKFPDIYESGANNGNISVAVVVSGSESRLVPEFRAALEILDATQLHAAAIVSDADNVGVPARVGQLLADLNQLNTQAQHDGVAGFPLTLPAGPAPGFGNGMPRIGLHILPDNQNPGTLETLLLECSTTSYPYYQQPAVDLVNQIDGAVPPALPELRALRQGAGRQKAAAGIIGAILFPAASLAVAIERGSWLDPILGTEQGFVAARDFIDTFLA